MQSVQMGLPIKLQPISAAFFGSFWREADGYES